LLKFIKLLEFLKFIILELLHQYLNFISDWSE